MRFSIDSRIYDNYDVVGFASAGLYALCPSLGTHIHYKKLNLIYIHFRIDAIGEKKSQK